MDLRARTHRRELRNRRSILEYGDEVFKQSKDQSTELSLIMLDVDNFKSVNDAFGHQTGDEVLKAVASRLECGLADQDLFARYGGEEFVVILSETNPEKARNVAERLRNLICQSPIRINSERIRVTVSLGVAGLTSSMVSIFDLLDAADQAMLSSKQLGRDRVEVYTDVSSV